MFCSHCGSPMSDSARFCPVCGAPREDAPASPQQPQQPVQQYQPQQPQYQQPQYQYQPQAPAAVAVKPKKRFAPWKLIVILAAVAVIAAAVVLLIHFNVFKSDETLIRERIQALEDAYNQADMDGVMDCFDESTRAAAEMMMGAADGIFSNATGLDLGLGDLAQAGGVLLDGHNFKIHIDGIKQDGDTAIVTITLEVNLLGFSNSEQTQLPMIKVKGDWFIGGILENAEKESGVDFGDLDLGDLDLGGLADAFS